VISSIPRAVDLKVGIVREMPNMFVNMLYLIDLLPPRCLFA